MKRVLITGSTGFVGNRLWKTLYESAKYDLFHQFGKNKYNLCDKDSVERLFASADPDIVIHLAAKVGGIGANAANPGVFMRENLEMGLNVINTALDYRVEKFIMCGTVCMYPKFTPVPFKEEDLWNGYPEETNAPYGLAKKTLIELCSAYHKQFGFNCINLIPVNMMGPEDNFNPEYSHVIPAIILKVYKALKNSENAVVIWGTGQASREFLYVDDFVQSIILALNENPGPEPINIGTGQEIKICDLVNKICSKMGFSGDIIYDPRHPDGQPRRCLNIDKAKDILGYEPRVNLDTGLDHTIKWFLDNTHKMNKYIS